MSVTASDYVATIPRCPRCAQLLDGRPLTPDGRIDCPRARCGRANHPADAYPDP